LLLVAAWYLGPELVARYQYAATRGRITAEYENARILLDRAPLENVSIASQLVAQRIRPSVVNIEVTHEETIGRRGTLSRGQGSGVIMSADGYIVTNAHVVGTAKFADVTLDDRRPFSAEVIGRDEDSDLAVLKIDADNLLPAEWGDSDAMEVGSMVWAVGSPYGLEQTVTSGILSAKERYEKSGTSKELLQTDAAINPGNSGGPLVNSRGQVIGINTSIYGESFLGISFAVPSSFSKFVFDEIIAHGKVTRGYLGILPDAVSRSDMLKHNLPDLNGAVVLEVPPRGPADRVGLRPGDIIRRWEGKEVKTYNMLFRYIGMTPPETSVSVDIVRDGQPLKLQVTVGDKNDYVPRERP
jgi:S1-C subfamily serine protease